MNTLQAAARHRYGALLVITIVICLGTGLGLYGQRNALFRSLGDRDRTSDPVFQVDTADGRMTIQLTDLNQQWDWNWTAPDCLLVLAAWAAPSQVRALELQLIDPGTHPLGLPIRSLYPEEHASPGIAGAWCETRGLEDHPDLLCSIAPLTGVHPAHVTVAVMGALAQAGTYALAGETSLHIDTQAWSWARWHPLVQPGDRGTGWQSACPVLTPQTRRFS